jgi:phasin family protein
MKAKAKPEAAAIAAWKKQIDTGWRVLEAMTEGARRMHELQLEAAVETHAKTEASRKLIADIDDAREIWRIQADWLAGIVSESAAYWRQLYGLAAETQTSVANCVCGQASTGIPAPGSALIGMMDEAYKRWLDTTKQFYSAPVVAQPQLRERA